MDDGGVGHWRSMLRKVEEEGRRDGGERSVQMREEGQHAMVMVVEELLVKRFLLVFAEARVQFTASRSTRWC